LRASRRKKVLATHKKNDTREEQKAGLGVALCSAKWFPQGTKIMWNGGKYAAIAVAGAGFAVAAATPASACFDWGYSGAYSYGWPYANAGYTSSPAYSYRSCGGHYNIPGWGECGGYGRCGWAPFPPLVITVPVTESAATAPRERIVVDRRLAVRPYENSGATAASRRKMLGNVAEVRGMASGH
jgi:hypothetical protein